MRKAVINFVENVDHRHEFLQLMASWWEFSEEDLLRVGLAEDQPPQPDLPPDATLTEAFANYLERRSSSSDGRQDLRTS